MSPRARDVIAGIATGAAVYGCLWFVTHLAYGLGAR